MGKVRTKKEGRKKFVKNFTGECNESQLTSTVGKLESDIGAISLGPPRSKILKKSAPSASSSSLTSNFASRNNLLSKQKKKVRFCQNILAEELKKTSTSSDDAKQYFKVIHPSAIEKRLSDGGAKVYAGPTTNTTKILDSIIPEPELLMTTSSSALRKIIKKSTKRKKTILKVKKESFKKKMELLKSKRDELLKAKLRQQTVIVGDMHPMLQALPPLTSNTDDALETDLVLTKVQEEKPKHVPNKPKYSVKKTQQAILDSLKFFEASGVSAGVTKT